MRDFAELVRTRLSPHADRLAHQLATIARRRLHPDAFLLLFEADPAGFHHEFPVVWDPYTRSRTQLPGRTRLLPGVGPLLPARVVDDYVAAGVDTASVALDVLVPWFAQCWKVAGGAQSMYPAYVESRDRSRCFDLRRGVWIASDAKWSDEPAAAIAGPGAASRAVVATSRVVTSASPLTPKKAPAKKEGRAPAPSKPSRAPAASKRAAKPAAKKAAAPPKKKATKKESRRTKAPKASPHKPTARKGVSGRGASPRARARKAPPRR